MKLPFIDNEIRFIGTNKGQSAIFLAFFLVTLLLVCGFSLDSANIFLKKSKLQRAVDAAAMAGITLFAEGDPNTPDATQRATRDMILYNLKEMNIKEGDIVQAEARLDVNPDRVATLNVIAVITVHTLFVRLIGLDELTVAGSSAARRKPVAISLVLDVSGSMASSGKVSALKAGATAFLNSFQDGVDQMALIAYSTGVTVEQEMKVMDIAKLTGLINKLGTGGWTNIAEAVTQGRLQLERVVDPNVSQVMLIFTDGAPNTIQAVFEHGIEPNLVPNYPAHQPVFYEYTVDGKYLLQKPSPPPLGVICDGLSQCLADFVYFDSREARHPNGNISNLQPVELLKESHELAIIETDYAKSDGVTIYTIGLGVESEITDDPFQDVAEFTRIKSILLRRLANDPATAHDVPYEGFPIDPSHPEGTYLQTPDPDELDGLFQTVANRIKLQLIE